MNIYSLLKSSSFRVDPRRRIGLLISSPFSSIDVINPFMSTAAACCCCGWWDDLFLIWILCGFLFLFLNLFIIFLHDFLINYIFWCFCKLKFLWLAMGFFTLFLGESGLCGNRLVVCRSCFFFVVVIRWSIVVDFNDGIVMDLETSNIRDQQFNRALQLPPLTWCDTVWKEKLSWK